MSPNAHNQPDGLSRRGLIGGAAALGAGTVAALGGQAAHALPSPRSVDVPTLGAAALDAVDPALTYLPIDGVAFLPGAPEERLFSDLTGTQPQPPSQRIAVSLALPVGSVIHQISTAYQVQPIVSITRRDMVTPNPPADVFLQTLAAGGGAKTQTLVLPTPITIEHGATYSLQYFCSAGDSVYGATVAYTPPTQGFQAFVGSEPRILDTRTVGGKLEPSEERVIGLGFSGARGAVLNVTVADTEGGGFVAVFRAGIGWPGNSSVNWDSTGQLLSNGVITALDAGGQIIVRGGANRTHVIIDRIGWLL